MVRTFCDRCGRTITGLSKLESVTIVAGNEKGTEIVKLDFCAFCADWAINTLMRRTMLGAGEKKGAREMDKLEFDLNRGTLRKKVEGGQKTPQKDGAAWTAKKLKEAEAETPPKLDAKGCRAAEKKHIFELLVQYKTRSGAGWTERVSKACGGTVSRETLREIVADGLAVDIRTWRIIERALGDLAAAAGDEP